MKIQGIQKNRAIQKLGLVSFFLCSQLSLAGPITSQEEVYMQTTPYAVTEEAEAPSRSIAGTKDQTEQKNVSEEAKKREPAAISNVDMGKVQKMLSETSTGFSKALNEVNQANWK